jgi:hypothetical protein
MKPKRSFVALDNQNHKGNTNTWFTPPEIIAPLGPFDLDPCTQSFRPFDTAARHVCEDLGEDGLSEKWEGRVWLNPPYGPFVARWLGKLAYHRDGIALVFARTETEWAQSIMRDADAVNFLSGRIAFIRADGTASTNAGMGSMLIAFGDHNVEAISGLDGIILTKQ